MLSSVEYEKSFITSEPVGDCTKEILKTLIKHHVEHISKENQISFTLKRKSYFIHVTVWLQIL